MAGKDMDLMMRIRARGDEALKTVHAITMSIGRMVDASKKLASAAGGSFSFLGRALGFVLSPLKTIAAVGGGVVAIFAGLTTKAIMAAASEEKLAGRFTMLYGSADKAKKKMAELENLALGSSFSKDDLAEAAISLEHVGLGGAQNLKILGAAAKVANKSVSELAMDITALRSRSMKQMGITMDQKDGNRFVFSWQDKMGQVRKVTAKGAAAARQDLLKILNSQYGSDITPKGLTGMIQRLKNQIESGFERFGAPLLAHAEHFVKIITEKLGAFITSGKLEQWGEVVAEKLQNAFVFGKSVFEYAKGLLESLKNQDPGKWADAIKTVIASAAEILAMGFITYLSAAGSVFSGIGKIIAGAFIESVMGLDLLGMGPIRNRAARAAIDEADDATASKVAHELNPVLGDADPKTWLRHRVELNAKTDLNHDETAKIASMNRGAMILSGLTDMTEEVKKKATTFASYVDQKLESTNRELIKISGYDTTKKPSFEEIKSKNQSAYENEMDPYVTKDLVRAVRMERRSYREGNRLGTRLEETGDVRQTIAEPGQFKPGMRNVNGTIFNYHIGTVTVRASKEEQLSEELKKSAGIPQLAAAGT